LTVSSNLWEISRLMRRLLSFLFSCWSVMPCRGVRHALTRRLWYGEHFTHLYVCLMRCVTCVLRCLVSLFHLKGITYAYTLVLCTEFDVCDSYNVLLLIILASVDLFCGHYVRVWSFEVQLPLPNSMGIGCSTRDQNNCTNGSAPLRGMRET
jgi:hypothetical protein